MEQDLIRIKKRSFWDILTWIALIIFLIYFFLLVRGKLNSSLGLDMIGIISLGYILGIQVQKLNIAVEDISELKIKLDVHIKDRKMHEI